MNQPPYSLGRIPQFDELSRQYPIRSLLPSLPPHSMFWVCDTWLDQGNIGSCVGNAHAHDLAGKPVAIPNVTESTALQIYRLAQTIDGIPGPHEGTSVLAGEKAKQQLFPGCDGSFHWCFGVQDVIDTLSHIGPVILGINWYTSMFTPNAEGIIEVKGRIAGGHALLCNQLDARRGGFWLHNSWSQSWGSQGKAFI